MKFKTIVSLILVIISAIVVIYLYFVPMIIPSKKGQEVDRYDKIRKYKLYGYIAFGIAILLVIIINIF